MTRKERGMRTQKVLAERWKAMGLFPYATPTGAGRPGRDVVNTPGLAVEVKAKGTVSLPQALRQAWFDAAHDEIVAVVWRHNLQGEKTVGQWTVTVALEQFEEMFKIWQEHRERNQSGLRTGA